MLLANRKACGTIDSMNVDSADAGQPESSVAKRVLTTFVDAVADEPGFKDVAERLRKTIIEDDKLSEAALRHAMFGEADT